MGLYLWRFSAYGFQTIEHLSIVISDVSWNAEQVIRIPWSWDRIEEEFYCRSKNVWPVPTRAACVFLLFTVNSISCRPIFQYEGYLFHVAHAWRCSITAVSLGISWAAPTVTDGFVVEEVVVYPRSPDLNCLECLMWKHLEKELFVYMPSTTQE